MFATSAAESAGRRMRGRVFRKVSLPGRLVVWNTDSASREENPQVVRYERIRIPGTAIVLSTIPRQSQRNTAAQIHAPTGGYFRRQDTSRDFSTEISSHALEFFLFLSDK